MTIIINANQLVWLEDKLRLDEGDYAGANELTFQLTPPYLDELSASCKAIERLALLWKAQELITAEIEKLGKDMLPAFQTALDDEAWGGSYPGDTISKTRC